MSKKVLTIFTPSYNRAHLLHKCYESLKKQTNYDFIWLIIDDGSTDNTEELVKSWKTQSNPFEIQYYKKENGGLHTGYNEAIRLADTELMMCIDSDDYATDDCVEKVIGFWRENGSDEYAGILGLDIFEDGQVIGDFLPQQKSVSQIKLLTGEYGIQNGDRKPVVRTELYKSVAPMPSYENEKNFNPHYMHLEINKTHDFLVLNEPLCVVEYQEGGMTNSIFRQYMNSPLSFAQTRRLYMTLPEVPKSFMFKQCIHYVSSCILAKRYRDIYNQSPKKIMTILALPFGVVLSFYIRWKAKK